MYKLIVLAVVLGAFINMDTVSGFPQQIQPDNPGLTSNLNIPAETNSDCPDGTIRVDATTFGSEIPNELKIYLGNIVSSCISAALLSNGTLAYIMGAGSLDDLISGDGALGL